MSLAPHLRMLVWPRKFRPHLPKKYDGTVNPTEFLQIYTTSILAAGGNEAIMANYVLVVLTGMARSWLMNLPPGSLFSWEELYHQFTTNFESAYSRPGGVPVILRPVVLPGSKHHTLYIQCFYCCQISTGCER
jgi:hypothetical protein